MQFRTVLPPIKSQPEEPCVQQYVFKNALYPIESTVVGIAIVANTLQNLNVENPTWVTP